MRLRENFSNLGLEFQFGLKRDRVLDLLVTIRALILAFAWEQFTWEVNTVLGHARHLGHRQHSPTGYEPRGTKSSENSSVRIFCVRING